MMIFTLREIGKDTFYYGLAKTIPAIVGFIGIALYTRLLNPNEYGLYVLAMTVVSTVYAFGFSWIGYVIWRYFEKYKNENSLSEFLSTVLTTVFVVFSAITVVAHFVSILLDGYLRSHFVAFLSIGVAVLGVQVGLSLALEVIRLNRESKRYSLYCAVNSLGIVSLAAIFLYTITFSAKSILAAIIIVSGSIAIVEIKRIHTIWKMKFFFISRVILKKILTFGIPQIGIAAGALLLSIADRYMISAFIGSEGVGIYAAGYTIGDLAIQFPLTILTLAAVPLVVSAFENMGKAEASMILRKLLCVYFIVLTPMVFGIAALSGEIINFIVGEAFRETVIILPWVVSGAFFFGLSQIVNIPFQLEEKPHLMAYLIFSSTILNIALNLFMIPRFGILGAAYSTFIAYFMLCVSSCLVINRIVSLLIPWKVLTKSLLASLGMYLSLCFIAGMFQSNVGGFLARIGIGVCSYCLILLFLREETFLEGLRFTFQFGIGKN